MENIRPEDQKLINRVDRGLRNRIGGQGFIDVSKAKKSNDSVY